VKFATVVFECQNFVVPVQYVVDHPTRRVTVVWTEPVSLAEITDMLERHAASGAWTYGVLHDARLLTSLDRARFAATRDESTRLSATNGPRGPIALVVPIEAVGPAQSHAIRTRDDQQIEVFWSRDEAERWLVVRVSTPRRR
jgi:two-component sensor histidine kinase